MPNEVGKGFVIANKLDIATTKIGALLIKTPVGKPITLKKIGFTSTVGPVDAGLVEDYTFVGGADIPPQRLNRSFAYASRMVTCKGLADSTAVAGASPETIGVVKFPTGTNERQNLLDSPVTLKPDTNYLITFTNSNAATTTVSYELIWEE